MDFFQHQEQARRNTGRLVLLFALAVAGIVLAVYAAAMGFAAVKLGHPFWNGTALLWVATGVLGVVASGSLYKTHQLRGGGSVVAWRLGGTEVRLDTSDPHERRLVNVVEEMAIASGVPVPGIFVLQGEEGINAFAAGHGQEDAVVAVTDGALRKLTRDELQGVVGHEFSHILNGDMRLNMRLMGVIHGILLIGLIGRILLESSGRRRSGRKGGGQTALVGLALLVIGYVGTFFGTLIKAAVSRQREFLADAAAVQFTRNPRGLALTLAKIQGFVHGSRVRTAVAAEASHMFFGGLSVPSYAALATHPPVEERIRRIDPSFPTWLEVPEDWIVDPEAEGQRAPEEEGMAPALVGAAAATSALDSAPASPPVPPGSTVPSTSPPLEPGDMPPPGTALDRIGRPGPEHLARARVLWDSVPEPLRTAAHRPEGAVALAHALVIGPPGPERERQLALIAGEEPDVAATVERLLEATSGLDPDARLPLVEVAAAALGGLPRERFAGFQRTLNRLVEGDHRVELGEWLLARLLLRQVRGRLDPAKPPRPRYRSAAAFPDEAAVLLSALAHAGHPDADGAERAFAAAAREAGITGVRLYEPSACPPRAIEAALDTFSHLFPEAKRGLVAGCAASVASDARVLPREAELFRVVSDWIGVPVPPLLPGQPVA